MVWLLSDWGTSTVKEIRKMVQEKILWRAVETPHFVCPRNIFLAYREQEIKHTHESDKTENHWDKISITIKEDFICCVLFCITNRKNCYCSLRILTRKIQKIHFFLKIKYFNMRDSIQGRATINQSDSRTFCWRKEEIDYALCIATIYSF